MSSNYADKAVGACPKLHLCASGCSHTVNDMFTSYVLKSTVRPCSSCLTIVNAEGHSRASCLDDIKPHIIGITESWANNDIADAELGWKVMQCLGKTEREEGEEEYYNTPSSFPHLFPLSCGSIIIHQ